MSQRRRNIVKWVLFITCFSIVLILIFLRFWPKTEILSELEVEVNSEADISKLEVKSEVKSHRRCRLSKNDGLNCRPDCYSNDFHKGLFGRTVSSDCRISDTTLNGRIWLPQLCGGCTYENFATYDWEKDALRAYCPGSSEIESWFSGNKIQDFYDCDKSGCHETSLLRERQVTVGKVGKDGWATIPLEKMNREQDFIYLVKCGNQINMVAVPNLLVTTMEENGESLPDIIVIISDANYRFGFMEGLFESRKILEELECGEPLNTRVFDFMQHSCLDGGTHHNVHPLMSGVPPKFKNTGHGPAYMTLPDRYSELGYFFVFHSTFGNYFKAVDSKAGFGKGFTYSGKETFTPRMRNNFKKKYNGEANVTCWEKAQCGCHCHLGKTKMDLYVDMLLGHIKRRDVVQPSTPIFAQIHEGSNHVETSDLSGMGLGGQVVDKGLYRILKEVDLSKTVIVVVADHGMRSAVKLDYYRFSQRNPPLFMLLPTDLLTEEYVNNLLHNEDTRFTTHYDIYRTLRELPQLFRGGNNKTFKPMCERWSPDCVPPGSRNLITMRIEKDRKCKKNHIERCYCKMNKMRKANVLERTTIFQSTLEFMNARIDMEKCWMVTNRSFEVYNAIIFPENDYFDLVFEAVSLLSDSDFVAGKRILFTSRGGIRYDEEKNLEVEVEEVKRNTMYDLEKCIPKGGTDNHGLKEICICKDGNDLSATELNL